MKKKFLALAVLSGICAAAGAQEVTLYGVVDGGIAYTNKAVIDCPAAGTWTPQPRPAAPCTTGTLTGYQSNGESPSIFGFKGVEDLGGGMKANFDLEGHFLSGTGVGDQWGGLFGRQANVGLSGDFGNVKLGTQYSPAVLAYAATDPRGLKESFSGLMTWAFSQTPVQGGYNAATNTSMVIDVFQKNAISYSLQMPMGWMSRPNDGLNLALSYSFGGVAGSTQANRAIALGVTYTGPFILSASYSTENGPTAQANGAANEKYSIGAGYMIGDVTIKANYLDNKAKYQGYPGFAGPGLPVFGNGQEIANYKIWAIGADWKWSASNTATFAFYDGKNSDDINNSDTAKTWILSDDFALSKRTNLYALVAGVNAGADVTWGSSAFNGDNFAAGPVPGQTSMAFQVGIKHVF